MEKFVFGITGATGAGKSTVSQLLRKKGVQIIDADLVAREITSSNKECIREIKENFGLSVFNDDNSLNRKALARIVFTNKDKLKLLNRITHKYIKDEIERQIDISACQYIGIDGAVIIGSPVHNLCKWIVAVIADNEIRLERIMSRDKISRQMAQNRINSQMSNKQYEEYADFIIKNNDDNVRLEECIEQLYNKIKDFSKTEKT